MRPEACLESDLDDTVLEAAYSSIEPKRRNRALVRRHEEDRMVATHHPLDHLVYAVPSLAEAVEHFDRALGVRPSLGGRHEAFGSHNAILPMQGESYVELIALDPENPEPPQAPPFGLAELREARLVTWAVRSVDIDASAEKAKAAGYDPGLIVPVSRLAPDGTRLEWKLSLRPRPTGDGLVPFVIDWGSTPHPSNDGGSDDQRCQLQSFQAVHPEPEPVRHDLRALGAQLEVGMGTQPGLRAVLEGPGGTLELR